MKSNNHYAKGAYRLHITYSLLLSAMISALMLCGCSEEASIDIPQDNMSLIYDAACQSDTLRLNFTGDWTVLAYPEWITLSAGKDHGNILLPIDIQQNDDGAAREGEIIIGIGKKRQLTVDVSQNASDINGDGQLINLSKDYGLGWGFDLQTDIADVSGVRGQIFDGAALRNDWGEDAIVYDNSVSTNLRYAKGESSETLQKEMSGKISAGVDVKVASAKVSVEYSKQISEQKDRLYVWCRDYRSVRMAYFSNDVDLYDKEVIKYCTTYSFRKSVREESPTEIVRKFGTHLVTSSSLGGKLDYYFTVSSDITTEVEKIITTVNVKVLFFKTSHTSIDENVWQEVKKDFHGNFIVSGGGEKGAYLNSQLKQYASKGEPLTDSSLFDNWYSCFESSQKAKDSDLAMVDFRIVPIWYIIKELDSTKADAVKEYIMSKYLQ